MKHYNRRTDAAMMPSTFRWDARAALDEREKDIMKYAPLVAKVVNGYSRDQSRIGIFNKHDLIQSGFTGLVLGYNKMEETNGVPNVNYFEMWIKGEIDFALTYQSSDIVIPKYQITKIRAEIVTERIVGAWLYGWNNKAFRLDDINPNTYGKRFIDTIVDKGDSFDNEEMGQSLSDIMWQLTNREREIVSRFYGINYPKTSMKDMEEIFGISRMQISRIKKRALDELNSTKNRIHLNRWL